MCIELEDDDKRFLFTWENIEDSEERILLDKMGFNYEDDDCATKEYEKIIKYLQGISPRIRWRVTNDGTDRCGGHSWAVFCVPHSQLSEAQNVFNRFLDGDNLENYCYTDRYPEIFAKLPNRQSKLKDNIVKIIESMLEYGDVLCGFDSGKINLADFFDKLLKILPQIYFYASSIPPIQSDFSENPDIYLYSDGVAEYDKIYNHPQLNKPFYIISPYGGSPNSPDPEGLKKIKLVDLLMSICEYISSGKGCFYEKEPALMIFSDTDKDKSNEVVVALEHWSACFSYEGGGSDILFCLVAIDQTKHSIKNRF